MFARNGSSDAKAETNARFGRIARGLAPIEWRENPFLLLWRKAGPVIIDDDDNTIGFANDIHTRPSTVFNGIVDQVRDRLAHQGRSARNIDTPWAAIRNFPARFTRIFAGISDEYLDIYQPSRLLPGLMLRKSQCGIDHGVHRFEIVEHLPLLFTISDKFSAKAQTREWRSQIVRDRGQHLCPVFHEAL